MMKTVSALFAALTVCGASAAAESSTPHVTAIGQAVTELQPDLLRWNLLVRNKGPEIGGVAEAHTKLTAALIDFLKKRGTAQEQMQTSQMTLGINRIYQSGNAIDDGYVAATTVIFTSKDFSAYRDLWLGLSKLEGVSIQGTDWDSSRRIAVRNSTRADALRAAAAKAADMAGVLNARIAEPISIEEQPLPYSSGPSMTSNSTFVDRGGGAVDESVPIALGSIPIQVRVQVTFRLVAK